MSTVRIVSFNELWRDRALELVRIGTCVCPRV